LKTGHIIGATPWKQQVMLILGVLSSAVVMPPILNLLNDAYGFGTDGDLPAPQASLMDSVSRGVILGGLPWGWVATGGAVAVLVISIDRMLAHYKIPFAMPVLGFAVGFYLPLATGVPIMAGALVSLMTNTDTSNEASEGVLFAGIQLLCSHSDGTALWFDIMFRGTYYRRSADGHHPCYTDCCFWKRQCSPYIS